MVHEISGGITQSSYGNIRRTGSIKSGRVVYSVIDSKGEEAGQLTVPQQQSDTFEKAYADIMESAPKIQEYAQKHSSQKDREYRKNIFKACIATGGFVGAAAPLIAMRNSASVAKQIISAVIGILVGIASGFCASMILNSPPESLKFARANYKLSKIDIEPVNNYIV